MGKSSARGGAVGVAPPTRGRDRLLSREVLARELLSPDQIDDLIRRESYRTDRNGREFSLVLFQLPPAERGLLGRLDGRRRVPTLRRPTLACIRLARTLAHRARAIDEIGWFNDRYLCALLPETSAAGARVFARHVCDLAVRHAPHDAPRAVSTVYSYPSGWFVSGAASDASSTAVHGSGRRVSDERLRTMGEHPGRRAGEHDHDHDSNGDDDNHLGGRNGRNRRSNGQGGNGHVHGNGHGNGNGNGHAHPSAHADGNGHANGNGNGNGNSNGNGHHASYRRSLVIFDAGHDTAYAGAEGPLKRYVDAARRGHSEEPSDSAPCESREVAAVAVAERVPEENAEPLPSPASQLRREDLVPFFLDGVAKGMSHPGLPDESLEQLLVRPMPAWKRTLDLFGATIGLIVLSPFFAVAAAAIWLTSPGPVIFRQRRAGLGGRPFTIYKFRTMAVDAEQRKHELRDRNEQDGPAFKLTHDPRVTSLGKILRKTSIDELPQLWNVIRGDMSLVGPRPLPCDEADACEAWQRRRLDVTPGLTCIWQVRGRSQVSFAEWVRMDVAYIRRRTILHDLKILFMTVPAVILRRGAR